MIAGFDLRLDDSMIPRPVLHLLCLQLHTVSLSHYLYRAGLDITKLFSVILHAGQVGLHLYQLYEGMFIGPVSPP
jgi:hypothetical protein